MSKYLSSEGLSHFMGLVKNTYVKKSGDTMSGLLTLKANQYDDGYTSGALNLNNSNIYGVNSIYTSDLSNDPREGIQFYRDATHVDSLWAKQGNLYFTPNRELNDIGTSRLVLIESSNVSEANLVWGGKNFSAGDGPIDAAMIGELGSNRIAFIKKESVTVEYSRDAGETWDVYDDMGYCLFGAGRSYTIGKADSTHKATENVGMYQLRVTIDTTVASVYTVLNKFVIFVSTTGSLNCTCKIQKARYDTPDTFVDHTDDIPIAGWSGWNIINTAGLTTHGNTASQFGKVRFLFKENGASSTTYNGLNVSRIMAFGGSGWNTPSNMAKTGHLYSYDSDQNAVFPGDVSPEVNNSKALGSASKKWSNVYSSAFVGTLIGNVAYATCDTAAGTAAKTATITPATTAFTLEVGRMVNVKFDNTNSAAVADISLNVNGTGAKHITYMYNNTRSNLPSVGYIVADFIYQFIYDGTYWCIQNIHYNTNTTYNLGNNNLYNTVIARELIKAQSIVVGDSTGYETAYPGVMFDITHPILFYGANTDLAKNGTNYTQFFTSVYDRNLTTTYSTFTGTKNATVYLVGTISGGIVTLSDPMLTCTKPTSADGKVYIPIGRLGNQSNGKNYFFFNCMSTILYEFKNGSFRRYSPINLSASTSSTSTTDAATSSAVKTAYDLADQANGTANTALSGVNGTLIYDHTYTIANGVATFTAHVYCKGVEVTNDYADADFSWSYRIDNTISGTGTPSVVSLGTGKTKTVNIAVLGLGGHVIGTFTTT